MLHTHALTLNQDGLAEALQATTTDMQRLHAGNAYVVIEFQAEEGWFAELVTCNNHRNTASEIGRAEEERLTKRSPTSGSFPASAMPFSLARAAMTEARLSASFPLHPYQQSEW